MPSRIAFCAQHLWHCVATSPSIRAAVGAATRVFSQRAVAEPEASAEYLATAAFSCVSTRRAARLSEQPTNTDELERFITLCSEREKSRTPIQYLVGQWDFHRISIIVRPPVLIPRPETEELVEHVLGTLSDLQNPTILDVGCGSGAILISILNARKDCKGVGVDISMDAITLSNDNASLIGVSSRAKWACSDISGFPMTEKERFDLLVSNPPYIPGRNMMDLAPEITHHEDYKALCGGHDGLEVVRQILVRVPFLVRSGGSVWMEVDQEHPEKLADLRFEGVTFKRSLKDIYGNDRFCEWTVN